MPIDGPRVPPGPGEEMLGWARDLFPLPRSLTGPGFRQSLDYLAQLLPGLIRHDIPSGTPVFDWTVPDEWHWRAAYIETESGERVIDAARHNLHLVGYSEPVDQWLTREELEPHLYSRPDLPDAIPYVTSYYARRWGFCLTERQRRALPAGRYHVVIDADLGPGHLSYGEYRLPGESEREILVSTYLCHPSMANNELSGPVVTTALARWLAGRPRHLSYRFVFLPETIGAITLLSRELAYLKAHVVAGFVLTCIGDRHPVSFLASRLGDSVTDRLMRHVLRHKQPGFVEHGFLARGSDERQYCSPGADLPVVAVMRSKFGAYPEYHTSLDDLSLISAESLAGGFEMVAEAIEILEHDRLWRAASPCEPQLGKRGLYPTLSTRDSGLAGRRLTDVLAYADGGHDLVALADRLGVYAGDLIPVIETLAAAGLILPGR